MGYVRRQRHRVKRLVSFFGKATGQGEDTADGIAIHRIGNRGGNRGLSRNAHEPQAQE